MTLVVVLGGVLGSSEGRARASTDDNIALRAIIIKVIETKVIKVASLNK